MYYELFACIIYDSYDLKLCTMYDSYDVYLCILWTIYMYQFSRCHAVISHGFIFSLTDF
jgi:hypothetical protein